MANYRVDEIREQREILELSRREFDELNQIYHVAVAKKFPLPKESNFDKVVLTDGFIRVELSVKVTE